ncbi:MrcB family domain-containing protein [Pseudorhodobacter sp. MZDSW-24AT]|uniref:MrcB family domain-containing protein n=1 Tax=Pseudorhodobacter sp. MZDSW-24AT TaxID=2052957 RepID=UPI000C1DEA6C|nr:DUF3578 domain-containing protein [Pseudorhodobacter sp. MZDSW-24AT]PJF09011.1 hypothetical protein CUR21_11125 [Pseudorhodobacter sp. MZDSW-24AT]
MLHKGLSRLALEYSYERTKPFAGSEFGNFVRHDLAIEAKKHILFLPYDLKVKASVGAGVWAAVPWLAFFDPLITETATTGFYIVYLVNSDTNEIFLSLNQGTTAIYREYGEAKGQDVLRRRALDMCERVSKFSKLFDAESINLGSEASLPKGYMAGHAFGRRYDARQIDKDQFDIDLERMLSAYQYLIDLGGMTPSDVMQEEAGTTDIEETRRYILSRRIERASNVRPRVLERKGLVCEGCGLDPKTHLRFTGPPNEIPLDVHHSKPIMNLAEGESRRYKIPDDFMVLCPTCHRLIHKMDDPSDLDALRDRIAFTPRIKTS